MFVSSAEVVLCAHHGKGQEEQSVLGCSLSLLEDFPYPQMSYITSLSHNGDQYAIVFVNCFTK